ncbi:MAG: HepT-like ribonuclease domain-containing protein [Bryobacteraceae bacterium]
MKDDRLYLHHMVERCHRIIRFISPGREAFMASDQLQDAVIRNVEVIGEAAKRVSSDDRDRLRHWIGRRSAACATF